MTQVRVCAYVDADEVLDDISVSDLTKYLDGLGYVVTKKGAPAPLPEPDTLNEVREALREGRYFDAELMIDRVLFPKWKDFERCEAAYKEALSPRPISSGQ